MNKRLIAGFCAVLMLLSFSACKKKDKDDVTVTQPNETQTPEENLVSQGGKKVSGINAKSISITPKPDGAKAVISFVLGDETSNVDEAATDSVPEYKSYMVSHPTRFVVEFESLDYWGFDRTFEVDENDPLLYDVFKVLNTRDDRFYIVFQLKKDVTAKATESKDSISVDFTLTADQPDKNQFFAISDATQAFNEGKLSSSSLFPTLANDLSNLVLISNPYDNENDAKSYVDKLISEHPAELNDKNTFVGAVDGNQLPGYGSSEDFELVNSQTIVKRNGKPETLPVIMPDGIYMCSSPDGTKNLFTKQQQDVGDELPTQQLWIMDAEGKLKILTDLEFAFIKKAAFSPQGNKLAFIEQTAETSHLFMYDLETNNLDNLGEEGLGNTTSTFIWDTLGTAIYAISGNDENQQLLKYDFTVVDESARLSPVEEMPISEGDLGMNNGELYFSNVSEDDRELIYKIKPEGGLRTEYAAGGSFSMSPDGKTMAILRTTETADGGDDESTDTTSLILKDMTSGEEKAIVENSFIVTYQWSPNGKLYYTQNASENMETYKLMCYDISSSKLTEIAELETSDFSTTPEENTILIPYIDEELKIRATYKLKLN